MTVNILMVCTGNICRSPVAEHLLRAVSTSDVTVTSAGTAGLSGHGMDNRSLQWLATRDIDGSAFLARRVNRRLLGDADLVIGLEQEHVDACLRIRPAGLNRTFRLHQLAEWSRTGALSSLDELAGARQRLPQVTGDHPDPVGYMSAEDYGQVLDGIAADIAPVAELLGGASL